MCDGCVLSVHHIIRVGAVPKASTLTFKVIGPPSSYENTHTIHPEELECFILQILKYNLSLKLANEHQS